MANKFIGVRISSDLLSEMEKIVKLEGFSSIQEYVRHSIRETVKKHKLQKQLMALEGSQPNARRATKKELEEHAKRLFYP